MAVKNKFKNNFHKTADLLELSKNQDTNVNYRGGGGTFT